MVAASTLYDGRALPDEIRLAIGNNADRQTLCSLSLVSKAWMAVTNELVWRSLPSLLPLLGLFPDDSREIHSGSVATVVRVSSAGSRVLTDPSTRVDVPPHPHHARLGTGPGVLSHDQSN